MEAKKTELTAYHHWLLRAVENTPNPTVGLKVLIVHGLWEQNPQTYKLMEDAGQTVFTEDSFNKAAEYLLNLKKLKDEN